MLPPVERPTIAKYCEHLVSLLENDATVESTFRRAGELLEATLPKVKVGRQTVERTRAFTQLLIEQAATGKPVEAGNGAKPSKGTIKWFSDIKGYGFIRTERGGEVFLHESNVPADAVRFLLPGVRVQFNRVTVEGRERAVDIQLATNGNS